MLATLATEARDRGHPVIIVTGDRDSYQLVEDPYIRVLYNRRGVSDYALYDEAGIEERTGVRPEKYPLLAALRGDPSDNLPGVPGVGEKTAAKLVNEYGDLDALYAHLDALSPKLRENLAAHPEQVRRNAEVIPLVRDVPLDVHVDQLVLGRMGPRGGPPGLRRVRAAPAVDPVHRADGRGSVRRAGCGLVASPRGFDGPGGRGRPGSPVTNRPGWHGPRRRCPSTVLARSKELTDLFAVAAAMQRWPWPLSARWAGDPGRSPLASLTLVAEPRSGRSRHRARSTSGSGADGHIAARGPRRARGSGPRARERTGWAWWPTMPRS